MRETATCLWCGVNFTRRRRDKQFHSVACYKAHYRDSHAAEISEYNRQYGPRWRAEHRKELAEYNAGYHQENYDPDRRAAYYQANRERFRLYNVEYRANDVNKEAARGRLTRWRALNPEKDKASQARRRAAKVAAPTERFLVGEIFERDMWVCQICQEQVDPSLSWPDRRSPSLDHIVPLSKGGAHVRSNVQLAHYGCNAGKQARPQRSAKPADRKQEV